MFKQYLDDAKNKLLLLYLINSIDIPLSNSQISQFALNENYMNYFSLQKYLSEMIEIDYINAKKDNNTTRYTITEEGAKSLDYFKEHIPSDIRNRINEYILENKMAIKKDYGTTANYVKNDDSNDYTVNCSVSEDNITLMNISLSVVNKEQAKIICKNWQYNVGNLYGHILETLTDLKLENN